MSAIPSAITANGIFFISILLQLIFHGQSYPSGGSPVILIPGPGSHRFKITPRGCDRHRYPVKVEFEVPEE